jgi:putative endonuclease
MNTFSTKKDFGCWGEQIAADFLKKQGFQIVSRNFCCPYGEIDLIAKEKDIWCFIEVKTRRTKSYGYGFDSVTRIKQKHITKVAQYYLGQLALYEAPARFDVVSIDYVSAEDYQIQFIRNAFYMAADY